MSVLLNVDNSHNFVILVVFVMPKEFKLPNLMVIFKKIIKIEDYDLIAA